MKLTLSKTNRAAISSQLKKLQDALESINAGSGKIERCEVAAKNLADEIAKIEKTIDPASSRAVQALLIKREQQRLFELQAESVEAEETTEADLAELKRVLKTAWLALHPVLKAIKVPELRIETEFPVIFADEFAESFPQCCQSMSRQFRHGEFGTEFDTDRSVELLFALHLFSHVLQKSEMPIMFVATLVEAREKKIKKIMRGSPLLSRRGAIEQMEMEERRLARDGK